MGDENPLIVIPSKKKKKKDKKTVIQLTPEEIREAKNLRKNTLRKLQQLEGRAAQKKKRAELYKKLEENQIISPGYIATIVTVIWKIITKRHRH